MGTLDSRNGVVLFLHSGLPAVSIYQLMLSESFVSQSGLLVLKIGAHSKG